MPLHTFKSPRWLPLLLLASTLVGCGGTEPSPSPTPAGQVGPGEPDASGIPKPPTKGDGR